MARKPLLLSEPARQDFISIVDFYTAEASFDVARSFRNALRAEFDHIGQFPASGSTRYGPTVDVRGLRSWPVRDFPYLVFYAERGDRIDIHRILHTARDIPTSLRKDIEE
ncbi:MAG: type II toxin-antitoxin system RelE/ParE family toxin [Chloroflexi bacterium]|nr:type II toxin-antitoxin system RelE/ParE family toxin [Chloroflexota bacterium]MCY3697396.1 type II toxin-antitoxin system RelE/ParE family toxin [Chloroflexota bacterium]